jgi:hypothetical protein
MADGSRTIRGARRRRSVAHRTCMAPRPGRCVAYGPDRPPRTRRARGRAGGALAPARAKFFRSRTSMPPSRRRIAGRGVRAPHERGADLPPVARLELAAPGTPAWPGPHEPSHRPRPAPSSSSRRGLRLASRTSGAPTSLGRTNRPCSWPGQTAAGDRRLEEALAALNVPWRPFPPRLVPGGPSAASRGRPGGPSLVMGSRSRLPSSMPATQPASKPQKQSPDAGPWASRPDRRLNRKPWIFLHGTVRRCL